MADMASTHAKEEELKKKGEDSRVKMKAMLLQMKKELNERKTETQKVCVLSSTQRPGRLRVTLTPRRPISLSATLLINLKLEPKSWRA